MTLIDTPRAATSTNDDALEVTTSASEASAHASWRARAAALILDVVPGAAVFATAVLTAWSVPLRGGWWWMSVGIGVSAVLWTEFNRWLLPGVGGQTLGRKTFGIAVVRSGGSPVGPWTLLLRDLAHSLDTVPMLAGWCWAMKATRRRTFADILLRTESHLRITKGANSRRDRRPAALLLMTAAMLCAANATVSYIVVRQHDRSVSDVSAEISAQGPHMVEQILSYHPETIEADFDRARALTTDAYRGQLIAQQQAVQKVGPERNEYWVTDSSVLSAMDDRATMLLFLQGQRGPAPSQRYLTASVRVTFVESGSTWLVDDLTVVTNPPAAQGKP
ncbi:MULTISPECIES: RDD family protein [unclassified Mycobacterium]|uniref:RDD family protein n=1 Tax=unclassified Mycobacterium TaxID=2642494 RepID=UPI0029C677DF|nr:MULTISPECIES: RDD family protein [unclassified Mycobacterium]